MSRIHFTPWKDPFELVSLRDHFYPPPSYQGPDMRDQACSIVSVWKARGNLPQTVEATSLITSAMLHDDPTKHSVYSIQATYSTAFCRFVTALVDRSVHGRKKTMYHLAAEVGIPASFVELRHEATHRDMPSLVTLQRASRRALDWLWQYYWASIEEEVSASAGPGEVNWDTLEEDVWFTKDHVRNHIEPILRTAAGPNLSIKERKSFERESTLPISRDLAKLCSAYRTTLAVAQVLLEENNIVGDLSESNKIDAALSIWDLVLLPLSRNSAMFLTTFVEEGVRILISSPTPTNSAPGPYHTSVFKWLERILGSPSAWEPVRKHYLVLSYVQAICNQRDGYWAERLRPLVGDLPAHTEGSLEHESTDITRNGPAQPAKAANSYSKQPNPDEDKDLTALRNYGWSISETRGVKPIGVV